MVKSYPILLLALLLLLAPTVSQARILLAGGHLPVCSSLSPQQCRQPVNWPETALTATHYRIDRGHLLRWAQTMEQPLDQDHLPLLMSLAEEDSGLLSRSELTDLLHGIDGMTFHERLDDGQWQSLLDHLQVPGDQTESVSLDQSINSHAVEIFKHFVAMAQSRSQRQRPLIAVSTASSRDPYDAVDFYLQVFQQAGADVVWLPLDAAVRRARSEQDCLNLARYQALELGSYQRQAIRPERYEEQLTFCLDPDAGTELVGKIDGLFLNGGDQWLTLHAFRHRDGTPTTELQLLLERLQNNRVVIGGTSAGAAVQSGPGMISNGGNLAALVHGAHAVPPPNPGCERSGRCPSGLSANSLTWHPAGGLNTVPFAIVDTHFSERMRQLRLSRLLLDSGWRFGLGIDETTAVELGPANNEGQVALTVMGAGGAWVLDSGDSQSDDHQIRVRMRRLGAGESTVFNRQSGLPWPDDARTAEQDPCSALVGHLSFNELHTEVGSIHCGLLQSGRGQASWSLHRLPGVQHKDFELLISTGSILPSAAPD